MFEGEIDDVQDGLVVSWMQVQLRENVDENETINVRDRHATFLDAVELFADVSKEIIISTCLK